MNLASITLEVQERCGFSKSQADAAVHAIMEGIIDALAYGEAVRFAGFGSFELRERAPRTGRNPRTGTAIKIAATTTVKFRPGSKMRGAVAGA